MKRASTCCGGGWGRWKSGGTERARGRTVLRVSTASSSISALNFVPYAPLRGSATPHPHPVSSYRLRNAHSHSLAHSLWTCGFAKLPYYSCVMYTYRCSCIIYTSRVYYTNCKSYNNVCLCAKQGYNYAGAFDCRACVYFEPSRRRKRESEASWGSK